MAGNFYGVPNQELHMKDFRFLTSEIREHESRMKLKRRWLMNLPLSSKEQKSIENLLPPNDEIMPESFLREDDVSYEVIKTCIQTAFGADTNAEEPICVQDDKKMLTGGLNKFGKTKQKRSPLPLKEPADFRGNEMAHSTASESYRAAVLTVLDGLSDFPYTTLSAMGRRLRGVTGFIPTLRPSHSKSKNHFIPTIKRECMKILSSEKRRKQRMMRCFTADDGAEQLAGAMGVAGLTLKHILNRPAVIDFRRFSPEMEALHDDLGKAIHKLNIHPPAVRPVELRKAAFLLDPNFMIGDGSLDPNSKSCDGGMHYRYLRACIRKLLIEYLCECSDMDNVPENLIESLVIINGSNCRRKRKKKSSTSKVRSSSKEVREEEIEKEIEHVLNISAHAKEVVANMLPEHAFDEEFGHAYMEEYEECDTLWYIDDDLQMEDNSHHFGFRSSSYDQTECTGETNLIEFNSHSRARNSSHEELKSEEPTSFSIAITKNEVSDFQVEERDSVQKPSKAANEYLDLQEACDNTSTVAYRFVGYMLDTLAKAEGVALHQSDRLYLLNYTPLPKVTRDISNTLAEKFSGMWENVLEH